MEVSIDPVIAWGGRSLRRIVAALGVGLLAASVFASVPAAATAWDPGSAEATLWQLLNGTRVNNGLSPLQQHATLIGLARWRSQDMVDRGYFSHDVAGTGCQVYCWYDSNGLYYVFGGENIGWNADWSDADSPVRVHEQFMGSPGHRANVLEPAFTHGGVGAYGRDGTTHLNGSAIEDIRMYTELFMQAWAPSPPPPPPAPTPPPAMQPAVAPPPAPAPVTPDATPAPAPTDSPSAPEPEEAKADEPAAGISKLVAVDPLAILADPRMALEAAEPEPSAAPADERPGDSAGLVSLRLSSPATAGLLRHQ